MKINKNNNRKKLLIIGIIAGALLLGSTAFAVIKLNSNDAETSSPAKEESAAGSAKKLETLERSVSDGQSETTSNSAKVQDSSEQDSTNPPAMRITAKNQNGSLYQIRAIVDVVETGGKCTLTMTNSGSTITKEVEAQSLAQSTACKGFDVPLTELRQGTWNIRIAYKSNNTSAETSDVIEVK